MISVETATVYRGDGRRFLTKRSAVRKDVYARIRDKHEKGGIFDTLEGGQHKQEVFYTDEQCEYFSKVFARYWKRFSRRLGTKAK